MGGQTRLEERDTGACAEWWFMAGMMGYLELDREYDPSSARDLTFHETRYREIVRDGLREDEEVQDHSIEVFFETPSFESMNKSRVSVVEIFALFHS